MHDVHGWLLLVAFVLGLVLTFALTVRYVKRDVPVSRPTAPEGRDDQ